MNHLIRLLASQNSLPRKRVLIASLLSGLAGTLVLAVVNAAARELVESGLARVDWTLAAVFTAAILAYAFSEIFMVSRICGALEGAIHEARTGLLEKLTVAEFEKVEREGRAVFYEAITQATQAISQNSQFLALALRSIVMVFAILAYIAYVSLTAFVLVLAGTLIGSFIYRRASQRLAEGYALMMGQERRLFESVGDLLDGFKEICLSSARSRDLAEVFADISQSATRIRTDVQILGVHQFMLGQVAVFFLLGVVVFVVPLYSPGFRGDVVQVTTSVLFMTGELGALIQTMPMLASAEQAAIRMLQLRERLDGMREPEADGAAAPGPTGFREITLQAVSYVYPSADRDKPFMLGPIDLTLHRGEIVFVTGGNGSGKSTLIKLLTGLYRPQTGAIRVDGAVVGPSMLRGFRDMISAVFSDYHLFPRLYGIAGFEAAAADDLLSKMEMDGVTRIEGDRFERIDLSAGQRKRLALMAALLEERPLLVLDEWAADQDPQFRCTFYREILPALRAEGRTVVAVTHDDAYFDVADRRFHLEEGRLSEPPRRSEAAG